MYPTVDQPGYGSFVKNVTDGLESLGIRTKYYAVIRGRGKSRKEKIFKYLNFYYTIIKNFFKKYDVIYVHYPTYSAPGLLFLLKLKRKKLIVNVHGEDVLYEELDNQNKLTFFLGRKGEELIKNADLVVAPSEFFKEVIISKELADPDKIFVSPSGGINSDSFYPVPEKRNKDFTLGFVGRLVERKGIMEFIESFELISREINCKAVIIGYGPLKDSIVRKIEQSKLAAKVDFIEGVEQKRLGEFFNTFDLFLFPTRYLESLGLVGIEAMACGTPVIGSNIGGIPSYLKDGFNGYLTEPGSVSSITDAVLKYISLPEAEKTKMIENAKLTAVRYYNQNMVSELAERIKTV
ncbi:MAG: glycosyltransferase family 4 protein [Rikenellaceae bacterium]|nr:glycosyltransferase family 4 protein [Rikenellaceae bacterium]